MHLYWKMLVGPWMFVGNVNIGEFFKLDCFFGILRMFQQNGLVDELKLIITSFFNEQKLDCQIDRVPANFVISTF